ncbi:hypothetical protein O9993_15640 [Vibrio lentus]|nr:hypothetical protein [Vibrio lentus]
MAPRDLVSLCITAQAHFPLMSCWFEGKTVSVAGYSDGSKAIDYAVEIK